MSDLTINGALQAASTQQRNTVSSASVTVAPAAQETNVIRAGEYSQLKGTIDTSAALYVVQFRDSESGEVHMQYPSKAAASAYQKTSKTIEPHADVEAPVQTQTPAAQTSSAPAPHAGEAKMTSTGGGESQA
jgi:hypothetical protein